MCYTNWVLTFQMCYIIINTRNVIRFQRLGDIESEKLIEKGYGDGNNRMSALQLYNWSC